MDAAHEWTDAQLERLERRMAMEYSRAARETRARQEDALREYAREREQRERAMDDTPEARREHRRWLRGQAARMTYLSGLVEELSEMATRANEGAIAMLNDSIPRVYAENANRAAFEIDSGIGMDTSFALLDEDAVRELIRAGDQDAPILREVNRNKDIRWNREHFTSAITQGVLQGESIPNIVKRTESIFGMNKAAAVRAARTATTAAENAGRVRSYRRAEGLGIDLMQEWMATLDGRTRDSHRALDGEKVPVGEVFSNGCRFPGDPQGPGAEVWNCRCTLVADIEGVDTSDAERWSRLPDDVTYEDWKAGRYRTDRGNRETAASMRERSETGRPAQPPVPRNPYRLRTGAMDADEYAEFKREQQAARNYGQIMLPKSEYGFVMSQLNTHMSAEDRKHYIVTKPIGDYRYTFINRGFDDYVIVAKEPID